MHHGDPPTLCRKESELATSAILSSDRDATHCIEGVRKPATEQDGNLYHNSIERLSAPRQRKRIDE